MRRHNDILIITHRLLCLFPGENRLFGSLAEYDAVAPLPPEPTPLAARIMARMTEIWALRTDARREVAHMLTFAFDAHVRALLHARAGGTEAGMLQLELEPYGRKCRVYSDLSLPANTAEAVAHGWRLKSVLKRWVSADEHHDAAHAEASKLIAQASPGVKSVRYTPQRLLSCLEAGGTSGAIAESIVGCAWLGAYAHCTEVADPPTRIAVYGGVEAMAKRLCAELSSREIYFMVAEFATSVMRGHPLQQPGCGAYTSTARGAGADARAVLWNRKTRRGTKRALGASHVHCPKVSGPSSRLIACAAAAGRWRLTKAEVAAAGLAIAPPDLSPAAVAEVCSQVGASTDLVMAAVAPSDPGTALPRFGRPETVAASALVRSLSLRTRELHWTVVREQQRVLLERNGSEELMVTVCLQCAALCCTARDGPGAPGMRVDLSDRTMACDTCQRGDRIVQLDAVGKIITHCTAFSMQLVDTVLCTMCASLTVLQPNHVFGVMPVCSACSARISTAPTHCFCGRGLWGSFRRFLAQNEAGEDSEYAACAAHEKFVPDGPCCISDLRIIALKRP